MRFGVLVAVLGLIGCASSSMQVTHVSAAPPPPKVTQASVSSFTPGVTTADQVMQTLGTPASDIVTSDGERKLAYSYGNATPHWIAYLPILSAFSTDVPSELVVFRFHRDGTLADIKPPTPNHA
jgi:hypothetical protein